jgi:RNA polymerase sigma factor (sigma-70 family)
MTATNDAELLSSYATQRSEEAFATLVERNVSLVYSCALRQTRDSHLAEEVTQAVFIILARKAGSLGRSTVLAAWLCRTAHFAACNALKAEHRRRHREQEAYMQSNLNETDPAAWEKIAPSLDEAVAQLGEADRNAVVLRYYEQRPLEDVGRAMGTNADTAQKRVSRALEKLRKFFMKRGVVLSVTAIAGAVSANSLQAAPAGLAQTVSAVTLAKSAAVGGSIFALVKGTMKTMTWIKIKFAAGVGVGILLAGGAATLALSDDRSKTDGPAVQQEPPVLIVPGESVGPVRKGMTTNEVEAMLGQPDKWQGKIMVYDKQYGMSVSEGKNGVAVIFCGDSMLGYPGVKTFKGHTKEGIGMESTREEVIKAFGQPTTAKPWGPGQEQLEYKALGLTFILESGKVFNILVDFRTAG